MLFLATLQKKDYPFWHYIVVSSRDRLVVRTLRCGRSNPGSNPGHGSDFFFVLVVIKFKCRSKI